MLRIFILAMVRLELNGVKFAYGHTTKKWLSWDLNGGLTPKPVP